MTQHVFVEEKDSIVTLTLDSHRKLNALNKDTWEQLNQTVDQLTRDDEVRCIVLRGPDHSAFAAGADIAEFETVVTVARYSGRSVPANICPVDGEHAHAAVGHGR